MPNGYQAQKTQRFMPKKNLIQKNKRRKKRGLKQMNGMLRPAIYAAIEDCNFVPVLAATTETEQKE